MVLRGRSPRRGVDVVRQDGPIAFHGAVALGRAGGDPCFGHRSERPLGTRGGDDHSSELVDLHGGSPGFGVLPTLEGSADLLRSDADPGVVGDSNILGVVATGEGVDLPRVLNRRVTRLPSSGTLTR